MSLFNNRNKKNPYLIAEMACAHQGNLESAKKLVDVAKDTGFDCIQIQIFNAESNLLKTAPLYEKIKNIQFSLNEWNELIEFSRSKTQMDLSIFAYDEPSLDFAINQSPDLIKLNSSELSNPYMLRTVADSEIPFTLGTGASSLDEIKAALKIVKDKNPILMHGLQNFPTAISDLNIYRIKELQELFECEIMLADHTDAREDMALWIDSMAMSLGVSIFEKHTILDNDVNGIDSESSLVPNKLKKYVKNMRSVASSIGSPFGSFNGSERKYRAFQKKYCVTSQDLKAGSSLKDKHVKFLRLHKEMEGITPLEFENLQDNMKLKIDLKQNEVIQREHLEIGNT